MCLAFVKCESTHCFCSKKDQSYLYADDAREHELTMKEVNFTNDWLYWTLHCELSWEALHQRLNAISFLDVANSCWEQHILSDFQCNQLCWLTTTFLSEAWERKHYNDHEVVRQAKQPLVSQAFHSDASEILQLAARRT